VDGRYAPPAPERSSLMVSLGTDGEPVTACGDGLGPKAGEPSPRAWERPTDRSKRRAARTCPHSRVRSLRRGAHATLLRSKRNMMMAMVAPKAM
jgi:hypothetical protein